jgi:hypothetical protein
MMYEMTVPMFVKGLENLNRVLEKGVQFAEAKRVDADVLPNSRLAPDQFNLIRQTLVACDTAKLCASRVTGKEAPKNDDTEKTFADLQARIKGTLSFLKSITAKDFAGAESKRITTPRWEGKSMTAQDYVLHHALPNFYFHITTAYSILRHNGVDIGKKDYLGELPFQK